MLNLDQGVPLMALRPTPAIIGFGAREGLLFVLDKITRKPSRPARVLDYLRKTTPPGDPGAALAAMDRFAREQRFLMNIGDVKGQILREALKSSSSPGGDHCRASSPAGQP